MAYLWTADLAAGSDVAEDELAGAGIGRRFDDQAQAEAWLTATYEDLVDLGVTHVSLFDEDRLMYGPMSLDEQ